MSNTRRQGPGRGRFTGKKEKPKSARNTLKRLWRYMEEGKGLLLLVFVVTGLSAFFMLIGPVVMKRIIDRSIPSGDRIQLIWAVAVLGGLYILGALTSWLQIYLMAGVSQRTLKRLRRDLFAHLQILDIGFFDSRSGGELVSRITNDVESINNALTQSVTQFFSSILTLVGVTAFMFTMNVPLSLITVSTAALVALYSTLISKNARKAFKDQQKYLGELNGIIEESVSGQKIIKMFGAEETRAGLFEEGNRNLKIAAVRANSLSGLMGPSMNLVNNLRFVFLAASGGLLHIHTGLSIGTIAAFLHFSRQFGRPLNQLAQLYTSIQGALAGAERIFEILDERPAITDVPEPVSCSFRGHLEFRNVSFAYPTGPEILKDISLTAQEGQTVALVGPTGAGKTTVINLLTRFYDVQEGAIELDGCDIRNISLSDLRSSLGVVLQDTFLFGDTVRENIRYGRLDAGDDEVEAAARTACADHFIRHLPEGYDTKLTQEGGSLSQGQRQLLAIARAVLADPALLILDEATSSVDTRTEMLIQEGMTRLMKGRTSIVIAHRLSTIRDADNIVVIEDGRIKEQGRHGELLEKNGLYARLHRRHFETGLS